MFEQLPDEWIMCVREWAEQKVELQAIYVFGSRAKGCANIESDLDLAVVTKGSSQDRLDFAMFEGNAWKEELRLTLPVRLDFQFADPIADTVVWPAVVDHGLFIAGEDIRLAN